MTFTEPIQDVRELRVSSEFRNSHRVREFVRDVARACKLDNESIADLALAVTEVFNNAVEHAHRFEAGREVVVRVYPRDGAVEVDVADQGPGFTPSENGPLTPPLPTQRGLGLFLARQLVDEVTFGRGAGTTVHLVKTAPSCNR